MSQMLARSAGTVVVQEGDRILIADRRTKAATIAIFVLGLLTFILGANGLIQFGLLFSGQGLLGLAIGATLAAGLFGAVTWRLVQHLRARREEPVRADEILCAIDLGRNLVLAPNGGVLAPVYRCKLERRFQVTSSSRSLVLITPEATITIARGDPFSGDVGPIADALADAGFRPPQ